MLPKTESPIFHFYCKKCMAYVGKEDALIKKFGGKLVKCSICQYDFNITSRTDALFFVQLKLKPQLQNIVRKFKNDFISNEYQVNNDIYDDVTSGDYYKSIKQKIPDLLSLTFNTDGVEIFKSKKKSSLWPLLMVVNEVPKKHRFKRENMILAGLWYGGDPDFNMYLKPFIEDVNELAVNKFSVKVDDLKLSFSLRVIIFSTDTPAKAKVLNCMLFNGYYGCPYCLHPGIMVDNTMRYNHMENVEKRTHEMIVSDAMKVIQMREKGMKCNDVRGIKGLTPLVLLPQFDIVKGTPIDYLHFGLHGINGRLSNLWFDSTNHNQNFYIGRPNQVAAVDKNIATIRPPKEFTRHPRSIQDRAYYKASEQLNWLLHYGAASVYNILPSVYLKHFQLFSSALFTLNKDEFTVNELEEAEKRLQQFSIEYPSLYGIENEVFNEHLTSHITESVRNCGPAWVFSNFPFEDMNGVLKKYVNGTTDVLKQIVSKYLLNAKIREKMGNEYGNVKAQYRKKVETVEHVTLFVEAQPPSIEIQNEMLNLVSKEEMANLKFYKSCSVESNFIKCFSVKARSDNSVIKAKSGEFHRVFHIYKLNGNVFFCTKKLEISQAKSTLYVEHLQTILSENVLQVLPATEFLEKCIHIRTTNHSLISTFPNTVERY